MNIGEKIYNLRKKKNLSQEELAEALSVSRQTISKWETGESNPDFDKIVPLCNYFNLTTDELLTGGKVTLEKEIVREHKKNKALSISLIIVIFCIMCILTVIFDEIKASDALIASTVLACLGAIGVILVYYFTSKPLVSAPINNDGRKIKLINSIYVSILFIVYFGLSLIFGWEYTWIILIVGMLIKRVIELVLLLKGDKNE